MNVNRQFRMILLIVLAATSILSFAGSIILGANYFLNFRPNKIAAEWQLTRFFAISYLIAGIVLAGLFIGLLKMRRWFLYLYAASFVFYICYMNWMGLFEGYIIHPKYVLQDIAGLALLILLPIFVWVYLFMCRRSFV